MVFCARHTHRSLVDDSPSLKLINTHCRLARRRSKPSVAPSARSSPTHHDYPERTTNQPNGPRHLQTPFLNTPSSTASRIVIPAVQKPERGSHTRSLGRNHNLRRTQEVQARAVTSENQARNPENLSGRGDILIQTRIGQGATAPRDLVTSQAKRARKQSHCGVWGDRMETARVTPGMAASSARLQTKTREG